jgi:hypothetical protein
MISDFFEKDINHAILTAAAIYVSIRLLSIKHHIGEVRIFDHANTVFVFAQEAGRTARSNAERQLSLPY